MKTVWERGGAAGGVSPELADGAGLRVATERVGVVAHAPQQLPPDGRGICQQLRIRREDAALLHPALFAATVSRQRPQRPQPEPAVGALTGV